MDIDPWAPSVHVSNLKCSELDLANKICQLVGPAGPLTCSLNCNFTDRQNERGLQLFSFLWSPGVIQMVEAGQLTDDYSLCSLHQTKIEKVTID